MRPSPLLPSADKSSRYVLVIIKLPDPYDSRVQHNIFIICFRLYVPIKTLGDYREMNIVRTSRPTASLRVTVSTNTCCSTHTDMVYGHCFATFFFCQTRIPSGTRVSTTARIDFWPYSLNPKKRVFSSSLTE